METGIFTAFSKKVISSIIALGSMFYSTIDGVTPNMNIPDVTYKNDHVLVSTMITDCFTDELDQIFHSGNAIPIYFLIELYKDGANKPDSVNTFFKTIQYSPIGDDFAVYNSILDESNKSLNFEQAKVSLTQVRNYRVCSSDDIVDNEEYNVKITAWLDKIQLDGMEEELNLINYWNSIKPESISPIFSRSGFQI